MSDILEKFKKSDKIPQKCLSSKRVPDIIKGWGNEEFVYHQTSEDFEQSISVDTVKILNFNAGKRCSLHQHIEKSEFFYILFGRFFIEILDLSTQIHHSFYLKSGDKIFVPRGMFHRMLCEENGSILEISTLDQAEDSYRLIKGD